MNQTTRQAVYDLLKNFTQQSFKHYDVEELKRAYPFHRLFFDDAGLIAAKQERSVVTRMGMMLYPKLAQYIAREHFQQVMVEYKIEGILKERTADTISRIVRELRAGQRRPDHAAEINEILNANQGNDQEDVRVRVIADLFIGDYNKGPFFAEIKTIKPNLDIGAETKFKILMFSVLFAQRNPQAYLAFPYNPYVTRAKYKHAVTKRILDMQDEVLIGEEFWDAIGGRGTFDQLLGIIDDVGNTVRKEL